MRCFSCLRRACRKRWSDQVNIHWSDLFRQIASMHVTIFGKTGVGKSVFLQQCARAIAQDPSEGFTLIDIHGETARAVTEAISNPAHGNHNRTIHVLSAGGPLAFPVNPFETPDDTPEAHHDAALMWASAVENVYGEESVEKPRFTRINYVAGYIAAEKKLTLIDMLQFLSLGAHALRERLLSDFNNRVIRPELEELHVLACKHPREFLNQVEACKNRMVRWLGDRRLARIFGQQTSLNARAIMDHREICLVDLSALSPADAAFVGKILTCIYFAHAKRRPPHACASHRFIVDEAESLLCTETARLLDQSRKFGLTGIFSLQRLAQATTKGDFISDALMVNAGAKLVFNIPEHVTARYFAEMLFTGWIDLEEFKNKSIRPVAVGNEKVLLRNRSRTAHSAEHFGSAVSDTRSEGRVTALSQANTSAWGAGFSDSSNTSFALGPPDPLFAPPPTLSQSQGQNRARSMMASGGRSTARSSAHQSTHALGVSHTHARVSGTSDGQGESEAYVTVYQDLATQMYSLEEQLHRLTGEIMNLQRRELFIKIEGQRPWRTRTADLIPSYKSLAFKAQMLPRFLHNAAARSPYLVAVDTIDREIAARLDALTRKPDVPEPDCAAPQPTPTVLDDAHTFAEGFRRRSADRPKGKPKSSKPFRVIKGGADGGDKS